MRNAVRVIIYVSLIALSAQLTIDLNLPNLIIPVSGQTLAILTGAVFFKPQESFIAIIIYCLLGIIGLPVFSDGGSGWAAFSGGSLGYFIGFVLAATFVGYMAEQGKAESVLQLLLITAFGTLIILCLGSLNLARAHGLMQGFEYGFTPFILGGIAKVIIGVALVVIIRRLMNQLSNSET